MTEYRDRSNDHHQIAAVRLTDDDHDDRLRDVLEDLHQDGSEVVGLFERDGVVRIVSRPRSGAGRG